MIDRNSNEVNFYIHEICSAATNHEAKSLYQLFKPNLPPCKFILSSDSGVMPGLSVNREFSSGAVIRSLFRSNNVVVLDPDTLREMNDGGASFPIDYSISLDTQALSYLEPFIAGNTSKIPEDYSEVFNFIAQENVFVDPLPYCYENLRNLKDQEKSEKIFNKIKSYETLRTIDEYKLKTKGLVISKLSEQELIKQTQEHLSRMHMNLNDKNFMDALEFRQQFMYCQLLMMALIQICHPKKSTHNKVISFMEFCDKKLATLGGREIAIARNYFETGQEFAFFGKIQKNKKDIFQIIDGMAWDLWHIRQLESALTITPDSKARYFFPSLLTFDKRLIEVIDLYPLRSLAYINSEKIPMPFYDGNWFELIASNPEQQISIADRFYSSESISSRDTRRGSFKLELPGIIIDLENSLAKLCPGAVPLRKTSECKK
jgi:hypothetical protein